MKVPGGCYMFTVIWAIIFAIFGSMTESVLGVDQQYYVSEWPYYVAEWPYYGSTTPYHGSELPYYVNEWNYYANQGPYNMVGPYPIQKPATTPPSTDSSQPLPYKATITGPCYGTDKKDPTGRCRRLLYLSPSDQNEDAHHAIKRSNQ